MVLPGKGPRCDLHTRGRIRRPDDDRSTWRYQKLRLVVLEATPWCQSCGSTANLVVDHIRAIALGGQTELANLQTLCTACHRAKSAAERTRRGQGPRGATVLRFF